jgi:ABC-type transporter Mla maintaining outer membrane lipid asymmetry ATPase subunit MlaF
MADAGYDQGGDQPVDEFEYHRGQTHRQTDEPDAIEFVDVHKTFGRNHVLRGLNMALPENKISMILGPSGTGKSVCIKHIVGLLYPDEGDVIVHGRSVPSLPDIVLFDEPDSGLDPVRTALLCELIKEVHAENGGCYVVITHDIMSARRVAEHISVLWKGRIVESGPAEELFASENPFVRQFLSGESAGPLGME